MTPEEIAALQEQLATLTAQVTTLTEERDALKAKPVDAESKKALAKAARDIAALKAANDALAAEKVALETKVSEATTASVLRDAGISDEDDREYAMMKYSKAPADEDGDKPSLADFLADAKLSKAAWIVRMTGIKPKVADPKPAKPAEPAAVEPAAVVQPVATPAEPAAVVVVQPAAVVQPSPDAAANRTVVSTKATGGTFSAGDIAAMTPAQYKAHRALVRQQQGLSVPTGA